MKKQLKQTDKLIDQCLEVYNPYHHTLILHWLKQVTGTHEASAKKMDLPDD